MLTTIMVQVFVQCGEVYSDDDVIMINGTDEEIVDLQARLESRRLAAKVNQGIMTD